MAAIALPAHARAPEDQAGRAGHTPGATPARAEAARDAAHARLLRRRSAAAAAALRTTEAEEAGTTSRIEALSAKRAALAAQSAKLDATIAALLPLLRNLGKAPMAGVLASPVPRGEAPRDLLVLHAVAAGIAREETLLAAASAEQDATGRRLAAEQETLAAEHRHAVARADAIEQDLDHATVDEKAANEREATEAGTAAAAAARSASLRDAIASLQRAQGRHHPDAPAIAAAAPLAVDGPGPARLALPVAGPVVQRYGAPTVTGPANGISFAPPPSALVSSPCAGRIDFAGPFRSYGEMVIIDCGGDARVVLAGLDRLDAASGAPVRRGEPVGRMPDFAPGTGSRPTLLFQLRLGTGTADPDRTLPASRSTTAAPAPHARRVARH